MLGLDANLTRTEMDPLPSGLTIRSDMHMTNSARSAQTASGFRAEIDYLICGEGLSSGPVCADRMRRADLGWADAFTAENW